MELDLKDVTAYLEKYKPGIQVKFINALDQAIEERDPKCLQEPLDCLTELERSSA